MANNKKTPPFPEEKMYGSTLVGARGQVVIPAQARKDLKIKPGDRLMVMGKMKKALGLIKAEDLSQLLNAFMTDIDSIDHEAMKKHVKEQITKTLRKLKSIK